MSFCKNIRSGMRDARILKILAVKLQRKSWYVKFFFWHLLNLMMGFDTIHAIKTSRSRKPEKAECANRVKRHGGS